MNLLKGKHIRSSNSFETLFSQTFGSSTAIRNYKAETLWGGHPEHQADLKVGNFPWVDWVDLVLGKCETINTHQNENIKKWVRDKHLQWLRQSGWTIFELIFAHFSNSVHFHFGPSEQKKRSSSSRLWEGTKIHHHKLLCGENRVLTD